MLNRFTAYSQYQPPPVSLLQIGSIDARSVQKTPAGTVNNVRPCTLFTYTFAMQTCYCTEPPPSMAVLIRRGLFETSPAFCFFIKATAGGIRSCLFCAAALRQRSCNYLDQQSFVSNRKHCTVTCRCTRQEEYRIPPRMADMNIRYIFIQKEE